MSAPIDSGDRSPRATAGAESDASTGPLYCTRCGKRPDEADHAACRRWLAAEEPPRFCAQCARRMKVQVVPTGWAAQCSRHGLVSGGAGV